MSVLEMFFITYGVLMSSIIIVLSLNLIKANKKIRNKNDELNISYEKYSKLYSQKKSSEVRLGQIAENFAPFLYDFPYDSKKARFIGSPIDVVVFEEDEIVFVEFKTGASQLNSNQRRVRDLIKDGKVSWKEIRIS